MDTEEGKSEEKAPEEKPKPVKTELRKKIVNKTVDLAVTPR